MMAVDAASLLAEMYADEGTPAAAGWRLQPHSDDRIDASRRALHAAFCSLRESS